MTLQQSDPKDFSFSTSPEHYRHLKLKVEGDEAIITLAIDPDQSLRKDTPLKLNSYDLGVDIELADAVNRIRFEYPSVSVVMITSENLGIFCSGANIYMLKKSSHAFKVNFCKYTNETRLYIEEASRFSNLKFLAALNGTAAGGGYELALACDRIILLDDKNANTSLPEVPLLGVLPGTGGLTRLVDKRKVRRDIADVFCTTAEGVKGARAKLWDIVDEVYNKSAWDAGITSERAKLKKGKTAEKGIKLELIQPRIDENGFAYDYVHVELGHDKVAKITINGPHAAEPTTLDAMQKKGSSLWLLQAFRELDDAILRLRFFHRDHGLWQWSTRGDAAFILAAEKPLYDAANPNAHWFIRELALHIGRVYRRLDVSSRSMIALVDGESAFVGVLSELLFICDRSYGRAIPKAIPIALTPLNRGMLPTWSGWSRLEARFDGHRQKLMRVSEYCNGKAINTDKALELELLTYVLDDIDFDEEVRLFKEERTALSPDALSAMEANLRFNGPETLATKIFGRLSAWQNWVFSRDNATGAQGALSSYGETTRPNFDPERC